MSSDKASFVIASFCCHLSKKFSIKLIVFTAKIQLFGKKVDLIILESLVDEDTKIVALTCLLISDFMQLKLS